MCNPYPYNKCESNYLCIAFSRQNYWTDLTEIWYKDSLEPEKGHMLLLNAKKVLKRGTNGCINANQSHYSTRMKTREQLIFNDKYFQENSV